MSLKNFSTVFYGNLLHQYCVIYNTSFTFFTVMFSSSKTLFSSTKFCTIFLCSNFKNRLKQLISKQNIQCRLHALLCFVLHFYKKITTRFGCAVDDVKKTYCWFLNSFESNFLLIKRNYGHVVLYLYIICVISSSRSCLG